MHAVVVEVAISDFEQARALLLEEIQPAVRATPGFQGGTWMAPIDGRGMSVALFDTEENARAMAERMAPGTPLNDYVTVRSAHVREVVLQL